MIESKGDTFVIFCALNASDMFALFIVAEAKCRVDVYEILRFVVYVLSCQRKVRLLFIRCDGLLRVCECIMCCRL